MKTNFKVGDRVLLKKNPPHMAAKEGAKAEVTDVDGYVYVKWLCPKANGQRDGAYYETVFEIDKIHYSPLGRAIS